MQIVMKRISKKFRIVVPVLLTIMIIGHTGCNDWLNIEPESELIKQEFWKTSDDVMAVMAATYNAMRETTIKSFLLGEVRADFISVAGGEFSDYSRIGNNDISSTNWVVRWGAYYNTINLANTVMYYAPLMQEVDKSISDRELEGIEAEMLFLRSLSYFYLVRIWKDVPLVLEPTISDTVDFYIPKSPENVVLNQVVDDLKRASALAFTDQFRGDLVDYKGRANKYAIQALLADVLLWQERYTECVTYCDSVINTGIFSLEPNTDWFDLYYPGNSMSESLFEIQYDDDLEGQENPMYYSLLNQINIAVEKIAYNVTADIRFLRKRGPIWKYRGTDQTGAGFRVRTENERDANFIYYRYADILLMKAEALAELNDLENANNLVTTVAERAGVTHIPTFSLEDFRNVLLAERGREFAGEGKRWFDVLRFAKKNGFEDKQRLVDILLGKASDAQELAIMRTKVIDTMSYYLPIHQDEIQFNRNLEQNPFYDR